MSYTDDLERGGDICPDCGLLECKCSPLVDTEPYPEPGGSDLQEATVITKHCNVKLIPLKSHPKVPERYRWYCCVCRRIFTQRTLKKETAATRPVEVKRR